jgi:hypothetical protein
LESERRAERTRDLSDEDECSERREESLSAAPAIMARVVDGIEARGERRLASRVCASHLR